MIDELKHILRVISTPSCWLRNYPTSESWDYALNRLLDKYSPSVSHMRCHTIMLGETEVWIANKFYAYGHEYRWRQRHFGGFKLPSRKTAFRLNDAIMKMNAK